jgi:hypothetical protein
MKKITPKKNTSAKGVKKKMTIDDLAGMVARGFSEVQDQFVEVHNKFKQIDTRLDNIDDRLDSIDDRLTKIENQHERRLSIVEDKVLIISTVLEKELKVKIPR